MSIPPRGLQSGRTRLMVVSALCEEALDLLHVGRVYVAVAFKTARPRRRLLLEQVLAHRLLPTELARPGLLEPLLGGLRRLHFRHRLLLVIPDPPQRRVRRLRARLLTLPSSWPLGLSCRVTAPSTSLVLRDGLACRPWL